MLTTLLEMYNAMPWFIVVSLIAMLAMLISIPWTSAGIHRNTPGVGERTTKE